MKERKGTRFGIWFQIGLILAMGVMGSCTYNARYIAQPKPASSEPLLPIRVGVVLLEDRTDKVYYNGGKTISSPIETLSDGLARALADRNLFTSVRFINRRVSAEGDLKSISEQNEVDAIIRGDITRFYGYDGPTPQALIFFPLSALMFLGLPSAYAEYSLEVSANYELLSCSTGSVLWNSGLFKQAVGCNHWYTLWKDQSITNLGLSENFSQTCLETAKLLEKDIASRKEYYAKAFSSKTPSLIASTPTPADTGATDFLPRPPASAGVLGASLQSSIRSSNRWKALLVGIGDYQHNDFCSDLKTPRRDVEDLAALLRDRYGFAQVDVLVDSQATRVNILSAFDKLNQSCSAADNILIYYAGHGDLQSNQAGFWLPADAKNKYETLSNAEIRDWVVKMPARRVLLVSDSCFSGSFLARSASADRAIGVAPVSGPDESARISETVATNARASREVLASGGMQPVQDAGSGFFANHSPFAGALITALESARPGAVLSTTDLYVEIYQQMKNLTRDQRPLYSTIQGEGAHAGGQYFFVRKGNEKGKE